MQEPYGQLPAEDEPGAVVELAFQRVERGPHLGVLAEHDGDRGCQSRFGLAQEGEQELLLQVDVAAQCADRACQRLRVPWRSGERRDSVVDLVVLSFESRG